MAPPATVNPRTGLIDDPRVEADYRRSVIAGEVRQGTFAIAVGSVAVMFYLINDWHLYAGTGRFDLLLSLRVATAGLGVIAIRGIRRTDSVREVDLWLAGYLLALGVMATILATLRPPESPVPYLVNSLIVVLFFMAFPGPTGNAVPGVLALALGTMLVLGVNGLPDDALARAAIPGSLGLGGVVGWYVSVMVQRTRRELFLALEDQRSANARLAEAQAEIRTLRGIIPICSHCKRIRDDKGYWQQLEAYISERSDAAFSHGICPDCKREHWP